jgi:hypothetical protein
MCRYLIIISKVNNKYVFATGTYLKLYLLTCICRFREHRPLLYCFFVYNLLIMSRGNVKMQKNSPYVDSKPTPTHLYHGQPYARVDFIPQSGTLDFLASDMALSASLHGCRWWYPSVVQYLYLSTGTCSSQLRKHFRVHRILWYVGSWFVVLKLNVWLWNMYCTYQGCGSWFVGIRTVPIHLTPESWLVSI